MDPVAQQGQPLSIAANVAGILIFVVVIVAAARVLLGQKPPLSWFVTESTWAFGPGQDDRPGAARKPGVGACQGTKCTPLSWTTWSKLRQRILELLAEAETNPPAGIRRIRDLESKTTWMETKLKESLIRLEKQIAERRARIHQLEDLVYRLMHRCRLGNSAKDPLPTEPTTTRWRGRRSGSQPTNAAGIQVMTYAAVVSFDGVSPLQQVCSSCGQAGDRDGKVELQDGPDPQAAQRRRLLQDVQIAELVGDVYQVTPGPGTGHEEHGLADGMLEAERKPRDEVRAGRVFV
ncbi:hypothetical protein CSUB01_02641 [Colletotrichum sublineola]|uniref:Uncharacterized protein n=1 Tax=Colletotrichum sublineola TaxID=1173701 RepID=A0A066Y0M7_COLSU|nr:hypothetical protein CSUB01_02641 [Colletotrichum sublineola]